VNIACQAFGDGPVDLVFVPGFISHIELAWEEPYLARLPWSASWPTASESYTRGGSSSLAPPARCSAGPGTLMREGCCARSPRRRGLTCWSGSRAIHRPGATLVWLRLRPSLRVRDRSMHDDGPRARRSGVGRPLGGLHQRRPACGTSARRQAPSRLGTARGRSRVRVRHRLRGKGSPVGAVAISGLKSHCAAIIPDRPTTTPSGPPSSVPRAHPLAQARGQRRPACSARRLRARYAGGSAGDRDLRHGGKQRSRSR